MLDDVRGNNRVELLRTNQALDVLTTPDQINRLYFRYIDTVRLVFFDQPCLILVIEDTHVVAIPLRDGWLKTWANFHRLGCPRDCGPDVRAEITNFAVLPRIIIGRHKP